MKGRTAVFPTPRDGHLLYLPKKGKAEQYEVGFLADGAKKVEKLKAGLSWSPFPHAWSPDGAHLLVCAKHELFGVRFPAMDTRKIDGRSAGQRFAAVDAAGQLYATEDSEHFTVRALEDDRVLLQERGAEGRVAFLEDGRFLLQSSLGVTRLYAVRGLELKLVAGLSELTMGCWEEGGQTFVNLSVDELTGRREVADLVRTCAVGDLDALYPEGWS
ncbi:MAG: hypothetical protein EVA89_00465 [Sandaracinaceae bacterium]|nr:MAG: hypothetical protein EVA89_00465 [Sandaracinaceae bacterium]